MADQLPAQQQQHQRRQEATWQTMLQSMRDWILSHNEDSRGPTSKENPALAAWVREQRRNMADFVTMQNHNEFFPNFYQNGTFTQRHIEQLNAIGFDWRETEFDIMFRQLENFKLSHGGSCNVPNDYADTELVRWVQVQRDNKHRLDYIGFEWQDENSNPNLGAQQRTDQQHPFQQQINHHHQQQGYIQQQNQEQPELLQLQQQEQLQLRQQQEPLQLQPQLLQEQARKEPQQPDEQGHDLDQKGAVAMQEFGGLDHGGSDNDCGGDDDFYVNNNKSGGCGGGANSDRLKSYKRGRKRIYVDVEQFSHLSGELKKSAIRSAMRAEKRRKKEIKRKKLCLFSSDVPQEGAVPADGGATGDGDENKEGIKEEQQQPETGEKREIEAEYLSGDSSSSEDDEPPDVDIEALLSDEEETPVQYTEEEILAFPVSDQKDWDMMFSKLVGFRNTHGHVNVPTEHSDHNLVRWCDEQRTRIKHERITRAEMHRLETVGFHKVLYKKEFNWNQMLRLLVELQKKAGIRITTKLLKSEKHPDAEKLRDWMRRQNQARKNGILSHERIEKLDTVGFEWKTTSADKWEYMFEKLCDFKTEHGHCRVPQNYYLKGQGKKERLGEWVRYQRKCRNNGSLDEEKTKRLDDLGFEWVADRRLAALGIKAAPTTNTPPAV